MSVAGITRQLGKTKKEPSKAGWKYSSKWHVLTADLATYTYEQYADTTTVIGEESILESMSVSPQGTFGYDITYNSVEPTAQI